MSDESVIRELEQGQKLKLSAAIRIGAKLRPQCTGRAFANGRSCAWGAAWEGSGHPYDEWTSYGYILLHGPQSWGDANHAMTQATGYGVAISNDTGWAREQIADWLESQGL